MFALEEILLATKGSLLRAKTKSRFLGISIDSRTLKPGELFIAIKGENFDGHNFINNAVKKGATGVIISRKVNLAGLGQVAVIKVKNTTFSLGDIARFHRLKFNIPVVAITGSNGKTTTKEMLSFTLKKRYRVLNNIGTLNNQIGVPLTLLKLKPSHEIAVLELGTNHFGEIDYLARLCQPNVAIITNIAPAHLEFFDNLDNVFKEKRTLLNGLRGKGVAIINRDDRYLNRLISLKNKFKVISFGIRKKSDFQAAKIKSENEITKFILNAKCKFELKSPAMHNVYNCLAVIACCKYFHLDYNCIQEALKKFRFPPGRLELKNFNKIRVIDDTYNANPLSFKNAIDVLAGFNCRGRKVLVCADMLELGGEAKDLHFSLGGYIAASGIDMLISIGRLGRILSAGARKSGMDKGAIFHFPTTEVAAREVIKFIKPNDIILVKGSRMMKTEKIVESLKNQAWIK